MPNYDLTSPAVAVNSELWRCKNPACWINETTAQPHRHEVVLPDDVISPVRRIRDLGGNETRQSVIDAELDRNRLISDGPPAPEPIDWRALVLGGAMAIIAVLLILGCIYGGLFVAGH